MIIRVLGEGQWTLAVDDLEALNQIDVELEQAVDDGNEPVMREALSRLFDGVKQRGTPVPDDVIVESDLVLPDPLSTLDEVRALLDSTSDYYGILPDAPKADAAPEPVDG